MSRLAKIDIRIDTLEPVVISQKNNTTVLTNSADYISGSILRGMLAGMYIRKFGGGDRVHEDAAFQRLFLSSNVRFVDANPLAGGQRSFALPFSLMKEKVNGDVQDILFAKDSQKGYKGIKGYGIVSDGKICMAHVGKSVSLHMSRNLENERISGKSEEGHIFNYESIDAGQSFAGEIIGSKEALQEMSEKLFSEKECFVYIGRSKYSQYGRCRLSASGVQEVDYTGMIREAIDEKGLLALRADTPYLPEWQNVDAAASLQELADRLSELCPGISFAVQAESVVSKQVTIANFVQVWNLKRAEEPAIAAGTVFQLSCRSGEDKGWTDEAVEAVEQLLLGGMSRRSSEGFGQFRPWQQQELKMGSGLENAPEVKPVFSAEMKKTVQHILLNRMKGEIRRLAADDAAKKCGSLSRHNHLFSRMEQEMLTVKAQSGTRKAFNQYMEACIRPGSPAEKNLKGISYGGHTLLEILQGNYKSPYAMNFSWQEILGKEIDAIAKDVDFTLPEPESDELYYEYWLWFFRHARKQTIKAATGKGSVNNE